MGALEVRQVRGLRGRRLFVDVPFRIHGGDPGWIPPLRLSVYDRLSPRHPAMRPPGGGPVGGVPHGRPVGRIGACVDSVLQRLPEGALGLGRLLRLLRRPGRGGRLVRRGLRLGGRHGAPILCVGPACFTTNDELGLQIDGFDDPPGPVDPAEPPLLRIAVGRTRLGAGHGPVGLALRPQHDGALGSAAAHPRPHPAAGQGPGSQHSHGRFRRARSDASSRCTTRPGATTGGSRPCRKPRSATWPGS